MSRHGMGTKQKIKNGAEDDVLFGKKWYCYLTKPGVASSIKRAMRRRERYLKKKECYEEE